MTHQNRHTRISKYGKKFVAGKGQHSQFQKNRIYIVVYFNIYIEKSSNRKSTQLNNAFSKIYSHLMLTLCVHILIIIFNIKYS